MSEVVETYRAIQDTRKAVRRLYGVPCPRCKELLPRAHPTILIPQQRCRLHGYVDERPELTAEDYERASQ